MARSHKGKKVSPNNPRCYFPTPGREVGQPRHHKKGKRSEMHYQLQEWEDYGNFGGDLWAQDWTYKFPKGYIPLKYSKRNPSGQANGSWILAFNWTT
jgi:hypothetical protein